MVRITSVQYEQAYEQIKRDSIEGSCIVFVASDVDALCACKIFQGLLKSDIIQHKIVPVAGYKDLMKANEELIKKDLDLRSVILINCGGLVDITQYIQVSEQVNIYIIDSHRPLNLDNAVHDNRNVFVFDEKENDAKMAEMIEAHEALMYNSDSEEDSGEDDIMGRDDDNSDMDDGDDGRIQSDRPRRRRRLDDDVVHSRKERARKRRQQNRLLAEYYSSGVYYANSSAAIVYLLASQLSKTNNELLWLAIVGVTSQYIFERNDTDKYMEQVNIFADDVSRFNIHMSSDMDGYSQPTSLHTIQSDDEYRFVLFRHWSLYDSMFHSGYVASKLGVWREHGKRRLNNMFAKMGFSLQQCQQIYTHMDNDLKQILRKKIEEVAPLYGLTDICFRSFSRHYGWRMQLSASDVVYALATLLETSPAAATRLGENVQWNEDQDWDALENESGDHGDGLGSVRQKWWMRNFYTAYDAVNSAEGLQRGIKLCMKIQKAIVRQATAIIDKRSASKVRAFRFIVVKDGPDLPLFQHPLTLSKLALFLTDAFREHGKRNLPFVLASLDEEHDSYLVVGKTGAPAFGDIRKNPFGIAFQEASERTGARISLDSFETSVLQIHKNDLDHFVENLYIRNILSF
ncbi:CDC45 family [Radiomyces spectabilis]|uniref:CDC45 family n=1 Tax=Radiomyces spectabilis TaxID=64574 RepID=UPI00221F91DB|nr:CDC45 family [Radiomyces spectabilis]KAI8394143.1 CDC45 family [Radiomyces spectabilis]